MSQFAAVPAKRDTNSRTFVARFQYQRCAEYSEDVFQLGAGVGLGYL